MLSDSCGFELVCLFLLLIFVCLQVCCVLCLVACYWFVFGLVCVALRWFVVCNVYVFSWLVGVLFVFACSFVLIRLVLFRLVFVRHARFVIV